MAINVKNLFDDFSSVEKNVETAVSSESVQALNEEIFEHIQAQSKFEDKQLENVAKYLLAIPPLESRNLLDMIVSAKDSEICNNIITFLGEKSSQKKELYDHISSATQVAETATE